MNDVSAAIIRNRVSIVVATYNRARQLPRCLNSLKALRLPEGVSCEVICVDNNSNDDTKLQIALLGRDSAIPIVYVFEAEQGLGCARNAGLRHARGEIIAMTDDDCIVEPGWIAEIWREFAADSALGLIGGRVELYDLQDLPVGIRTSRERQNFEPLSLFNHVIGCNMAFRRSTIDQVGTFDGRFGAGSKLQSAEDSDFVFRTAKTGIKVVYCPDIVLYHHHGRRTAQQRDTLFRSYRIGRGAFYAKHILQSDRRVLRLAFWEMHGLLRNIIGNIARFRETSAEIHGLFDVSLGMIAYARAYLGARLLDQKGISPVDPA